MSALLLLLSRVSYCITSLLPLKHIYFSVPGSTPSITISGGAVAVIVVLIVAISVTVVTIVALVLKYRQSIKKYEWVLHTQPCSPARSHLSSPLSMAALYFSMSFTALYPLLTDVRWSHCQDHHMKRIWPLQLRPTQPMRSIPSVHLWPHPLQRMEVDQCMSPFLETSDPL